MIISLLVVLLAFTGYLNHQLILKSQRKASKDYKNHELLELTKNKDDEVKEKTEANLMEEMDILDSAKSEEENALEAMYTESNKDSKNYFVEYRLSRDKLRASLVDRLDIIVNDDKTSEEVRKDAQKEIMRIGSNSEKELQIEGLIKGKGFDDSIVFLTEKDIKIVVSAKELSEQDMIKILDIVKSETNYENNNIKIMKKQ